MSHQEHFAHILKYGLARSNRFQVLIPLPPALQNKVNNTSQDKTSTWLNEDVVELISSYSGGATEITRGLNLMIEETDLPGKNLVTTDIRYNGDYYKLPYGIVYDSQSFVFRVSRDMHEKNIIDEWMNLIFDPVKHEMGYSEDYAVNIIINQLDEQDRIVYSVVLKNAFPTLCNPMNVSNESVNERHRMVTSFMYRRWERIGENAENNNLVDALSKTPFGPIVTPILSDPAVQGALEVFEQNTGIDLEGEAVNIYNQVDQIVKNTTGSSINKHISLIESIRANTEDNDDLTQAQKDKIIQIIDKALNALRS